MFFRLAQITLTFLSMTVATLHAQQIELISKNFQGTGAGNALSTLSVQSYRAVAGGRYVAFASRSNNLVPGGPTDGISNLYVRDLQTGTTKLASPNWTGTGGANTGIYGFEISENGRYLAFSTYASNLVVDDTNQTADMFIRDLQLGVTTRIAMSVPANTGGLVAHTFSLSNDGTRLVFSTPSCNLGFPLDRNRVEDVYLYDVPAGRLSLVSTDMTGIRSGNGRSYDGQISGNGRYVLFVSTAMNLAPINIASGGVANVYVRDLNTGITQLVSATYDGSPGSARVIDGHRGQISNDGRYVIFSGISDNFVPNDQNQGPDLFRRDLVNGITELVDRNFAGTASGNRGVSPPYDVSPDGRYVAFMSDASDLVPDDLNNDFDVFVRDMSAGITKIVTSDVIRFEGFQGFSGVTVSFDGRYVAFCAAGAPLTGSLNSRFVLFVHDLDGNQTTMYNSPNLTNSNQLFPGKFSVDRTLLVFNGNVTVLPEDNNIFEDVYVMSFATNKKRTTGELLSITPLRPAEYSSRRRPNLGFLNGIQN